MEKNVRRQSFKPLNSENSAYLKYYVPGTAN